MNVKAQSHKSNYSPDSAIKKYAAPLAPYPAMLLGLLVFHSAWAAILIYHCTMAAVLVLGRCRITLKQLFFSCNAIATVFMALAGLAAGILLYFLWPYLAIQPDLSDYIAAIGLTSTVWPWFLAYFIALNPFLEEYYWRGFLGDDSIRPVFNDFWYSAYHVIVLAGKISWLWLVLILLILGFSSWGWRQLNRISWGLLPSVISHFVADASIMLSVYLLTGR